MSLCKYYKSLNKMQPKKKKHAKIKSLLHERNKHRVRYDFKSLIETCPELEPMVALNKFGDESIDFFDPESVKMLNRALLMHFYGLEFWDIPPRYLIPPIPGRADYLHNLADLLAVHNNGSIPRGIGIKGLDVGIGASSVYPIIGHKEYGWSFIGSDIDDLAIKSTRKILDKNKLEEAIEIRVQEKPKRIFDGIIKEGELIDFTMCNPPFHASMEDAKAGSLRKMKNLRNKKAPKADLNFGGRKHELVTKGGEETFVKKMINESKSYANSCFWFSTLISKKSSLESINETLEAVSATKVEAIEMGQGNKLSRLIAWTFLKPRQQKIWASTRWKT